MEFLVLLAAAFLVAVVLTALFSRAYRGEGGWMRLAVFFIVILLFALAGGAWTLPYGPIYGRVSWFGVVLWGVLIALLLATFAPPPREPRARGAKESESRIALGALFWTLIAALIVAVLWAALRPEEV